jgi:putative flippase GtrA
MELSAVDRCCVEITVLHNFLWHERFTWAERLTVTPLRRFVAFNLSNGYIIVRKFDTDEVAGRIL